MLLKEFNNTIKKDCKNKDDWKCNKTGAVCKDYMCPIVKEKEKANKEKCTNNNLNRFNKIKW